MLGYFVFGAVVGAVVLLAWVRFAPSNVAAWHAVELPSETIRETRAIDGFSVLRAAPDGAQTLADLDRIIIATARTRAVAGSVNDGRITYVTRSLICGFPDFTTVAFKDGMLALYGRLRFGRSDLGVNRARIKGWLAQLDEANT